MGVGLDHPPPFGPSVRPGTTCSVPFCQQQARRRVSFKKPGWRVAEERDVCLDHALEMEAQTEQTPPPPPGAARAS